MKGKPRLENKREVVRKVKSDSRLQLLSSKPAGNTGMSLLKFGYDQVRDG